MRLAGAVHLLLKAQHPSHDHMTCDSLYGRPFTSSPGERCRIGIALDSRLTTSELVVGS